MVVRTKTPPGSKIPLQPCNRVTKLPLSLGYQRLGRCFSATCCHFVVFRAASLAAGSLNSAELDLSSRPYETLRQGVPSVFRAWHFSLTQIEIAG
jgi:hypothetical protein